MAGESIGWGGEFHLHNGTALQQIVGATEVNFPEDTVDEHEITPLNAAGKRKQYIGGLIDGGTFDVTMNYVFGSADDLLCKDQLTNTCAFKLVVPDSTGAASGEIDGTVVVLGYKRAAMTPNSPMTATLTMRVSGAVTEADA